MLFWTCYANCKTVLITDPEEEQKLLMADKALAKAQRVRTFHEKVNFYFIIKK